MEGKGRGGGEGTYRTITAIFCGSIPNWGQLRTVDRAVSPTRVENVNEQKSNAQKLKMMKNCVCGKRKDLSSERN